MNPLLPRSAVLIAAWLTAPFVLSTPAAAEPQVSVEINMARVLRIDFPAATVIVGNPAIADVTIQDPRTLILTGRSFGQTNLIVLNAAGDPIADTLLQVVQGQADTVTMYMGAARSTVACAPTCQPTISLGDNPEFTTSVVTSKGMIDAAAQ